MFPYGSLPMLALSLAFRAKLLRCNLVNSMHCLIIVSTVKCVSKLFFDVQGRRRWSMLPAV